jgi:Zn-dependent protease with chaperone function
MRFRQHEEAAQRQTRQLVLLFALVVVGLVVAVNAVLALAYWATIPIARGLPDWFISTNTALVLLFVLGGCWVESGRVRSKGGPHVAELAGARPVQTGGGDEMSRREQRFANIVQEMAIASGQRPPPQAWVLPRDDAINALAAGWSADDAVVVVTRGALERLTRAELQGVVAHEFSHIVHGDTRLNMRLVGMVWGLQMIWGLGTSLWNEDERGRRGAGALAGLALMAVGSLGWLAGRMLQAAVSRQREFLADASAVKFARHIDGLGGALRKIADQQVRHIKGLATAHAASLSHLLLSDQTLAGRGWREALATHPPLTERLARLYGRPFDADELLLAADRVGLEAPAVPMAALAPTPARTPPLQPAAKVSSPMPLHEVTQEAMQHDALQRPEHFDAAAREREAQRRIDRWYGQGEWQAAMLALAIDPHAADAPLRWRTYATVTADLHVAAAVREEVQSLGAQSRRHATALLLDRARQSPPPQRLRLLAAWKQRRRHPALAVAHPAVAHPAAAQWRALVVRHAFNTATLAPARGSLATHADAVRAATRRLSRVLTADAAEQSRWHDAAITALEAAGLPPRRSPGGGLAPPTPRTDARDLLRALRVRRLSPMQRPLLLRAWTDASRSVGLDSPAVADALALLRHSLDLPQPVPAHEPA